MVFPGSWSHGHLLLVVHPYSRLPEGKQVFRINHIVFTDRFGTVNCAYQLEWWEPTLPDAAEGRPCKEAFQWLAFMPAVPSFVDQK